MATSTTMRQNDAMNRLLICSLSVCALISITAAQPALVHDSLFAPSLRQTKRLSVYLPKGYDRDQAYPVLYLLHGFGGDETNWSQKTRLGEYLRDVPLIVVMPAAEDAWYINVTMRAHADFEQYIVDDLSAYVEQHYAVDRTRQAIAGLSMGGYGATLMAMKHPGRFRLAASISGSLAWPRFLGDTVMQPITGAIKKSLEATFGPPGSAERGTNDPFQLFRSVPRDSSVYFYFAIGTSDGFKGFLPATRMLTDSLQLAHIPYEYHELPGRHDWKFWDREIRMVLLRMRELMKF
jgi:putative tributyrin esterase